MVLRLRIPGIGDLYLLSLNVILIYMNIERYSTYTKCLEYKSYHPSIQFPKFMNTPLAGNQNTTI